MQIQKLFLAVVAIMATGAVAAADQFCRGVGNCCSGSGDTSCCAEPNLECVAAGSGTGCYNVCSKKVVFRA